MPDGLPDAWERGYFGGLPLGRLDDPDGNGYPNFMELNLSQSPVAIDLVHPGARPRKVGPLPSGPLRTDTPTAGPDPITPSCGICRPVSATVCGRTSGTSWTA